MHTVAETYFEAFAVDDPTRRSTAGIWRFDRSSCQGKVVGIGDSEVHKDIYTVSDEDGNPDTGIEYLLCKLEGAFAPARDFLLEQDDVKHNQVTLPKEHWSGLFRFVAAQLLRTPRFFRGDAHLSECEPHPLRKRHAATRHARSN